MRIPDIAEKIMPLFLPNADEEEENEEDVDNAMAKVDLISYNFKVPEQFIATLNTIFSTKLNKYIFSIAKILGYEKKSYNNIKDKLGSGKVQYTNDGSGGPNLYLNKKTDLVPDASMLYNFYLHIVDSNIKISCFNYETGNIDLISSEDIGDFSNRRG